MNDYVSKQDVMDVVNNCNCMHIFELSEVIPAINNMPIVEAIPVNLIEEHIERLLKREDGFAYAAANREHE